MSIGRSVLFRLAATAFAAFFLVAWPVESYADTASCLQGAMAQQESNGNMSETNNTTSAIGEYQTTFAALQSAGYITNGSQVGGGGCCGAGAYQNAVWTGKDGVNSYSDYMANQTAQTNAYTGVMAANYAQYQRSAATKNIPSTYQGVTLNEQALESCSYMLGGSGCAQGLANGTVPNWALTRMATNSNIDPNSCPATSTTTTTTTTSTTTTTAVYCDLTVSQNLSALGKANVNNWTALAGNAGTGYSLLGGQGVLQAAGLSSSGSSSGAFGGSTYLGMSCVDRLLNSNLNVNILFSPPSITQIMNALAQAACQEIQTLFNDVTSELSQSLFQNTNLGNLGGFLPGFGLGGLGGSVNLQPGSSTGPGVSITAGGSKLGVSALTGDTTWYGSNPSPSTAGSYSMFSNSGSSGSAGSLFGNLFGGSTGSAGTTAAPSSSSVTQGGLY